MARDNETIVIIGGSSGIGLATAQAAHQRGFRTIVIGRDREKLSKAVGEIGAGSEAILADAKDRTATDRAFRDIGTFDHLVIAASSGRGAGPFASLSPADLQAGLEGKFWAHWNATQAALGHLVPNGSITLITGASARVASPGASGLSAINGALQRMVPSLARELAPLRVNAVSPGVIDTPWWADKPSDMLQGASMRAPLQRAGRPEEVADAIMFLIGNAFVTGVVLDVDGGLHLT